MEPAYHPPLGECPHVRFSKRVAIAVAITLGMLLAALVLWYARQIVLLVFAGILVGIFLQWGKRGIMRYTRLPGLPALILLVFSLALLLSALLAFLVPTVLRQALELVQELPQQIAELKNYLYRFGWEGLLEGIPEKAEGGALLGENREEVMKSIRGIVGIFSSTFGGLLGVVVVLVIGIYIAADKGFYIKGIQLLLPRRLRPRSLELMAEMGHVVRWWLLGQSISMLILSTTVLAGLTLIGIPNATVLAVFTAVMTFIPNLGPPIAFIPIALTAMAQGTAQLAAVAVFYVIIQSVEGFFLTPMIHRKVITLPPVLILAMQVLLFQLAGFLGVLLAIPLVACAMVVIKMLYVEGTLGETDTSAVEIPSQEPDVSAGTATAPE